MEIAQVTSDEGKGLVSHAESILGVNHSPDFFHVQRENFLGMAASMAAQIRGADKLLLEEERALVELLELRKEPDGIERGSGRPF